MLNELSFRYGVKYIKRTYPTLINHENMFCEMVERRQYNFSETHKRNRVITAYYYPVWINKNTNTFKVINSVKNELLNKLARRLGYL